MYPYPYHPHYAPPQLPWPGYVYDGTVVGAPTGESAPSALAGVLKVAIVVAGVVGVYFIYQANKTVRPMQKQLTKAALKILGDEAKRTGRVAARSASDAAASLVGSAIDRHLLGRAASSRQPPRKMKLDILRQEPLR